MSQFNIFHKFVPALTLIALSAATINSAQAVQFYKWIDKNGSTHYTQEHPGKNATRIVKTVLVDDTPPPSAVNSNPVASNPPANTNAEQKTNPANPQSEGSTTTPPAAPQPMATQPTLITNPVPANHLITPSQEQTRPAFSQN